MRVQRLEASLVRYQSANRQAGHARSAAEVVGMTVTRSTLVDMANRDKLEYIDKEQQDQFEKLSEVARKAEQTRDAELLGGAFISNSDGMSTLLRYETSIERSLFKTLHELQRLQGARQGLATSAPVAIDVDVSTGN